MSSFDCVLFDLDGTLFDSSEGVMECYRAGLEHFGIYVEDDSQLNAVIGPSLYTSYREIFHLDDAQAHEAIEIYREKYHSEGVYKCRMYEGLEDALKELSQSGLTLCVATSKPQIMAEKIMDFSGLNKYFSVVSGESLDEDVSDKSLLINTALERANFADKAKAVMVGDRFYDIKGAKRAGVHSIGVTYGFGTREELAQAQAEYIADSPREIVDLILK